MSEQVQETRDYRDTMHRTAVPCDCGCGVVLVYRFEAWEDDPENGFVEFFTSYSGHGLRSRLRAAWRVVRGKDPWLHNVALQSDGIAQMRRAFGGQRGTP